MLLKFIGGMFTIFSLFNIAFNRHVIVDIYSLVSASILVVTLTLVLLSVILGASVNSSKTKLTFRNISQLMSRGFGFTLYLFIGLLGIDGGEAFRIVSATAPIFYIFWHALQFIPPPTVLKRVRSFTDSNPLVLDPLPRKSSASVSLKLAHISDLHLTADKTLEGGIDKATVMTAVARSLSWSRRRAPLIFITGDITDTADADEWSQFSSILIAAKCRIESGKLFIVPGNHDLSLTSNILPKQHNIEHFDHRSFLYIKNVLCKSPPTWMMLVDDQLISVRSYLDDRADYLSVYERHPPYATLPTFWRDHRLEIPAELVEAAHHYVGSVWPSPGDPLCVRFLEIAYPMVMRKDDDFLIVGLNSNYVAARNISGSAMGWLGPGQLSRLQTVLGQVGSRSVIILVHHHLGFPPEKLQEFQEKYSSTEIDSLMLMDSNELRNLIAPLKYCYVFHGHKHFPYHARLGNAVIVSAQSAIYGPYHNDTSCSVYQITSDKSISVVGDCRIPLGKIKSMREHPSSAIEHRPLRSAPNLSGVPLRAASGSVGQLFRNQALWLLAGLLLAASVLTGNEPISITYYYIEHSVEVLYDWSVAIWEGVLGPLGVFHNFIVVFDALFLLSLMCGPALKQPAKMEAGQDRKIWYFNIPAVVILWGSIFVLTVLRIPEDMPPPAGFLFFAMLIPIAGMVAMLKLVPPRVLLNRLRIVIGTGIVIFLAYFMPLVTALFHAQ
jgi:Calcineurin-like phosphoesterase